MDRASVFHEYICERCSGAMVLSEVEYADRSMPSRPDRAPRKVWCDTCLGIPVPKRPSAKERKAQEQLERERKERRRLLRRGWNNENRTRSTNGCIVTAREQSTGNICNQLDAAEGEWRVVTISTPNTILRDLNGVRELEREREDKDVRTVENTLLGKVGRGDLLEPRVRTMAVSR